MTEGFSNWGSAITGLIGTASGIYGAYQQGKTEKILAENNALIYEQQAKNITSAKRIVGKQYRQKAAAISGQAITTAARNGLKISGSVAGSISQSIMQLQLDNSYEQYNLELKKRNAKMDALMQRYQGKMAYSNGLMNAGNTALNAGLDFTSKYWKNDKKDTTQTLSLFGAGEGIGAASSSGMLAAL